MRCNLSYLTQIIAMIYTNIVSESLSIKELTISCFNICHCASPQGSWGCLLSFGNAFFGNCIFLITCFRMNLIKVHYYTPALFTYLKILTSELGNSNLAFCDAVMHYQQRICDNGMHPPCTTRLHNDTFIKWLISSISEVVIGVNTVNGHSAKQWK